MRAGCYRSGEICVARKLPEGVLPIANWPRNAARLRTALSAAARHAYDGKTLLVPGLPEANTDEEAVNAVLTFKALLEKRRPGRQT